MTQIVGATHPGKRDHNEDCFIADAVQGLGLVADGMGGYACGEVASELVRQTIADAISGSEGLRDAIARAHGVVKAAAASDDSKKGMGSTVIAFKLQGQDYELAWVGDSRAYLWDQENSTLHQITRDHSYVETLLSSGVISHDEAVRHPNRNLITQAVGVAGDDGLEIELIRGRLGVNQQLLICSDGLVDEVLDEEIATVLATSKSLNEAVNTLVERALVNGGSDNVTVVIAACGEGIDAAVAPEIVRSTTLNKAGDQSAGSAANIAGSTRQDEAEVVDSVSGESRLSTAMQNLSAMGLDPWVMGVGVIVLIVLVGLTLVYL